MKYQSTTDKSVIEAYKLEEYNVNELYNKGVSIREVHDSLVMPYPLEKVLKLSYKGKHYTAQANYYVIVGDDKLHIFDPVSFEAAFKVYQEPKPDGMNFGQALEAMKQGLKVQRAGWNGKGMWLKFVPNGYFDVGCSIVESDKVSLLPWIGMKTADDKFVPWLASQTDILAEDWQVVE